MLVHIKDINFFQYFNLRLKCKTIICSYLVASGDVIMTGEGHDDWLSDCDFHPRFSFLYFTFSIIGYKQ